MRRNTYSPRAQLKSCCRALVHITMKKSCQNKKMLFILVVGLMILLWYLEQKYGYLTLRNAHVEKAIMKETLVNSTLTLMKDIYGTFASKKSKPLLLLFTTFSPKLSQWLIHYNTIKAWGMLRPFIQPILYYDEPLDPETANLLQRHGWWTAPVPKSYQQLPIVRYMFTDAIKSIPASFYGYANSDILFDESLFLTLWGLRTNKSLGDFFLTGRRINFPMHIEDVIGNLASVRRMASYNYVDLFIKEALDYFIVTKNGFAWDDIPNFVIGKRGYDNYLMTHAIQFSPMVIDATNTILGVHQSVGSGDYASHVGYNSHLNMDMIPKNYSLDIGKTDCAKWETLFNYATHRVILSRRPPNRCTRHYAKYGLPVD